MEKLEQQISKERWNFIKLYGKYPTKITIAYNDYKILEDNFIMGFKSEKFKNEYKNTMPFDSLMEMKLVITKDYISGFKLE